MNRLVRRLLMLIAVIMLQSCAMVSCVYPPMGIYVKENAGKAALAEAEFSKKIAVEEAKAEKESAILKGEAEILRATATAEANQILGNSLKGNEAYLRYLWINKIDATKEVYYIPTEAGMPILEAGKRK